MARAADLDRSPDAQDVSEKPRSADVWKVIAPLEDVRRRLFAGERQANAKTRWWLLVPMLLLLAPMAFAGFMIAYPVVYSQTYWLFAAGSVLAALALAVEVWLGRKMLSPRWLDLRERRTLRAEIKPLKDQLERLRSHEPSTPTSARQATAEELIAELEHTRRAVMDLHEQTLGSLRGRYLLPAGLSGAAILMLLIFGIWMPLDTGLYGLLGLGIPLLAFSMWAFIRLARKFREPEIVFGPRRHQLILEIKKLEGELTRAYGERVRLRQPTFHAQYAWQMLPFLGPSPTEMLEALPEGTSRLRLCFHRHLGWGGVSVFLIAILLLISYTILKANV